MENNQTEKLNLSTKIAYGSGDIAAAVTSNILSFFLLPFLTNVAGLPAGLAGSVLTIGKISDAINDPIIGVMSDRTNSPWGRRLPWIILGALPLGLLFYLQWIVPHFSQDITVNNWCLFAYYVFIGILFNLAFTAVNLPYTALTPELTQDYDERTNLNSFRFSFSLGSSILSLILGLLIAQIYPNNLKEQYASLGLICSLFSVVSIFWCALSIQERGEKPILNPGQRRKIANFLVILGAFALIWGGTKFLLNQKLDFQIIFTSLIGLLILVTGINWLYLKTENHLSIKKHFSLDSSTTETSSFLEQIKIVFSNKPFLYVIGIYLFSWLGAQLTAAILVYFVVDWMGLSNFDSYLVALAVQGTALCFLFFWQKLSNKYGKKIVYFMGIIIWIIAQAGLFSLQRGQVTWMYILAITAGCGISVAYLIPWSMMPDVIEWDELKTGKRREGVFYGFMVLLQKFGLALGLFLVGLALEASGFIEATANTSIPIKQPESALLAIRIAIGPLPTIFLIGGLILAYFYPITKEVHGEIRRQLQAKYESKLDMDN